MHVSIDQPWKKVLVPGVNDFFAIGEGIICSGSNKFSVRDGNASLESFLRRNHPTALNDEIGFHVFTLTSFCLETLECGQCAVTDRAYSVDSATVGAVYDRPNPSFETETSYTYFDCGGAGHATTATGINNSGQVVGYCNQFNNTPTHGFTLSGGIDVPGAADTFAFGINDSNQIVGYYYSSPDYVGGHGFLRSADGTTFTSFDVPGASETRAIGINDSGEIVSEIVLEKRGVSPDLAIRLAKYFGTSPELWIGLQKDVDLWDAMQANRKVYDQIKPLERKAALEKARKTATAEMGNASKD